MRNIERNRQIAISLLIAVTVIYAVVLLQSIQAYEDWKRNKLEEYPAVVRPWIDFRPYFLSKQGAPMVMLGMLIGLGWFIAMVFLKFKHPTRGLLDKHI